MSIIYLDLSNYKNKLQLDREDHLAESVVSLTDKQKLSLYKKSQKSGYSTDVLEEVYRRGHMIWKPELFEGTREQFAFDRVNSFISGGFAADLDSDLLDEGKGLWANIHAKRERIKAGSGERMRKPGAKGAPTREAIKSAQNEELELEESESALAKKAKASGVSLGVLKKVYARGVAAWRTGHRPGTTPQQWGMARVNSYITKGKGTYHGADKDLREARLPEVPKDKETGLPKKYTTGEKGTDQARAAHFAKGREKHWDDPSAYEKAPGDATAKTRESKHTKKYRQMYGEELQLETKKLRRDPWERMTKKLPHLKASQERAEKAIEGIKQAGRDYQAILDKEKVKSEEYTGSEKVSKNKNESSSRFIGTKSLTDVYKKDTPGEMKESSLTIIKKIIKEDAEFEKFLKQQSDYKRGQTVKVGQEFKLDGKTATAKSGEGPYQVFKRLKDQPAAPQQAAAPQAAAPSLPSDNEDKMRKELEGQAAEIRSALAKDPNALKPKDLPKSGIPIKRTEGGGYALDYMGTGKQAERTTYSSPDKKVEPNVTSAEPTPFDTTPPRTVKSISTKPAAGSAVYNKNKPETGGEVTSTPSVEGPVGPGSGRELVRRPDIVSPEARKAAGLDEPTPEPFSKGQFDVQKELMKQKLDAAETERQQVRAGQSQRFSPKGPEKSLSVVDMVDIQLDKLRKPLVSMGIISPMNLRKEETDNSLDSWKQLFPKSNLGSEDFYKIAKTSSEQHNVPLEVVAGVFAHETGMGTSPAWNKKNNPAGIMDPKSNWKKVKTYEDPQVGINDAVKTISKNYNIAKGDIDTMCKRYAPVGAENDPKGLNQHWSSGVNSYIQKFRKNIGLTTDTKTPPKDIPNVKPSEVKTKDVEKQPTEPKKLSTRQRFNQAYSAALKDPNIGKGGTFDFEGKQYRVEETLNELQGYQGRKGQQLLDKVHKRATKRLMKSADDGDVKTARKNQIVQHQAYERIKEEKLSKIKEVVNEATYKGRKVSLNKPFRTPGGPKKSAVYVDPDGDGKAKIVRFGDPNLSIKKDQPARKRSYCARSSGQGNLNKKDSANYWSRRAWDC